MQIEVDEEEILENLNENDIELELPSYETEEDKEKPIQLIDFEGQTFKLNEEALKILSSLEDDIIIVSIVGKARTGKSYLMNLLLDNIGKKGFEVDSTISSCTKGIWLWGSTRKSQSSNAKILFIDSEGTSSIDRSTKTYDSKIFALVVLISSLFIYNTTANIDEHGISELSLAAHLSSSIATNHSTIIEKESLLMELAPKFIWVLRDFTLEKVHPDTGEEISSKEYLEICLRKKVSGKNTCDNNMIRDNIVKYFRERDCITLPRPVESEEELRNLKNIKLECLKPFFKMEFMNLKNKIFKDAKPKIINSKKLNGPTLVNLIKEFINAINSGAVPNINNAWDSVVAEDIKNFFQKSLNYYNKNLHNNHNVSTIELTKRLLNLRLETFCLFNQIQILNPEVFSNESYKKSFEENKLKLESEITKLEGKIIKEDADKKKKSNVNLLKTENKKMVDLMFNNYYSSDKNNFNEMGSDLIQTLVKYEENCDGPDQLKIICNFLNENMKEIIYYIVTNMKTEYKMKINDFNKNILMNDSEVKDLENSGKKLKEINHILESRITHLQSDLKRKTNEVDTLNEKYKILMKDLQSLKSNRKTNIENDSYERELTKSLHSKNEVRLDSNINRNECNCNCYLY